MPDLMARKMDALSDNRVIALNLDVVIHCTSIVLHDKAP